MKIKYNKFIVSLIIILNIIFTAAIIYVFLQTGNEPVTLIGSWFLFTTGELWLLAGIKKREQNREDE